MRKILLFTICSLAVLSSCNKNDLVEEDQPMAPEITLDSETGIYTVKVGRALTIAPTVRYAENALFSWTSDGMRISLSLLLSF